MGIGHSLAEHRKRLAESKQAAHRLWVSMLDLSRCLRSFTPGDIRNDLYLTLEKGDFERGGKSVQKNIEVTMYVLYADGEILKVRAFFLRDSGAMDVFSCSAVCDAAEGLN